MASATASVLFGESTLNARRKYQHLDDADPDAERSEHRRDERPVQRPAKGSLSDLFFGFMYEEELEETQDDLLYRSTIEPATHIWNPLNAALFLSLTLSTAATAVPVALVSEIGAQLSDPAAGETNTLSTFVPRVTSAAVLGTSVGKFLNGPVGDIVGARRTSAIYSILLSLSLILLALARTAEAATWACFLVEFAYSVQWPCVVVTLAAHYRGDSTGGYEGGIFLTSLAARLGSLISIPTCSLLLRHVHWRLVALLGSWIALVASSVTYLHVADSPDHTDCPQNPIDRVQLEKWFPDRSRRGMTIGKLLGMARFVIQTNILPSVRHILQSGTFWIVALAHTGASMVRTSERILGTYFYETSFRTLSEHRSSALSVFLSIGTVAGLLIAGRIFASRQERERKWLVSRLYIVTIGACYLLAFFAIPIVRRIVHTPELIATFQVMAVVLAGFGIAVQFYHIPSLVGATFGCDKGLFASYTDGVGYGLASILWGIVGDSVQRGNSDGGGWAYGWAAVALLLILSAILMVEFMEHYFCRHRSGGTYETIIFA